MNNSENPYHHNNECEDMEYNYINQDIINQDINQDEINEDDNVYDAEEKGPTRYNIVLCEIYNKLHGNEEELYYNYLTISRFKTLDISEINSVAEFYNLNYNNLENKSLLSPIRNYNNIITNENYIKPQIAEHILLESGHSICILKTFWLKIVQRKWKKVFNERKNVIQKRCMLKSILYREVTGKWPVNCFSIPTLQGILYPLKNI
jgi:hypothetical protein